MSKKVDELKAVLGNQKSFFFFTRLVKSHKKQLKLHSELQRDFGGHSDNNCKHSVQTLEKNGPNINYINMCNWGRVQW